jgi:flagellar hook-associated protein 3 FlgL
MRVSTQQQFDFYVSQIEAANSRYLDAQRQVITGKKFELASEDPSHAHFVISANTIKARTEQLDKNLRGAKDYLSNSEASFDEMNTMFSRAYTIAVNGANSTNDQASRDAMANEISETQRRLVFLANSTGANGQYIFAGQKSDVKPFVETPPTLTFNGDDNPINVEVRPNETMRVNTQGAGAMISGLYDTLETLKNDLLGGDVDKIGNQDIKSLQDKSASINAIRGDIGSKLQTVTALSDQNQKRIDDLTMQVSDAQDVDLSQAVINMQSAQTAYQAALQVTSRGQSLSLMDFLK